MSYLSINALWPSVPRALTERDRLLFSALLCLNLGLDSQTYTENEMSLLLMGRHSIIIT